MSEVFEQKKETVSDVFITRQTTVKAFKFDGDYSYQNAPEWVRKAYECGLIPERKYGVINPKDPKAPRESEYIVRSQSGGIRILPQHMFKQMYYPKKAYTDHVFECCRCGKLNAIRVMDGFKTVANIKSSGILLVQDEENIAIAHCFLCDRPILSIPLPKKLGEEDL